jgi:diguanylate cyclase
MRYTENKDKAAELLRLTLAQMGRHPAAFNPITFTVWYEHAAGINPKLNAALQRLEAEQTLLDDELVLRVYNQCIAPADGVALERINGDMQRLMAGVVQTATNTGRHAGAFGDQLDSLTATLVGKDSGKLTPQLQDVLSGVMKMRSSVDVLQQEFKASKDEINRLRQDLDRARGEAYVDPLTGILNRRGLDKRLQHLVAQPSHEDRRSCLVMLDIDHFKNVNDTHGHLIGDKVLQAVGEVLRNTVTNPAHVAARYGGEEFAIVMSEATVVQAAALAEAVRVRTRAMRIRQRGSNEVLLTVTISGGVTELRPGDDPQSLISRADAALYRAKRGGRDRVSVE